MVEDVTLLMVVVDARVTAESNEVPSKAIASIRRATDGDAFASRFCMIMTCQRPPAVPLRPGRILPRCHP